MSRPLPFQNVALAVALVGAGAIAVREGHLVFAAVFAAVAVVVVAQHLRTRSRG